MRLDGLLPNAEYHLQREMIGWVRGARKPVRTNAGLLGNLQIGQRGEIARSMENVVDRAALLFLLGSLARFELPRGERRFVPVHQFSVGTR